jgi:hypothetical protein
MPKYSVAYGAGGVPEGITEAENVVPHQNLKSSDDGHMGHTSAERRHPKDVSDGFQGVICVHVGIH